MPHSLPPAAPPPAASLSQSLGPQAGELTFNAKARPIWEVVAELGTQVSSQEWAKVPADAARNLDHYLYGASKNGA